MKVLLNYSRALLLILLSLGFFKASAQDKNKNNSNLLRTPYDAIYTHLHYLSPSSFDAKKAGKPFKYANNDIEKEKLAIYLKLIFDAKYIILDENDWPKDANFTDSTYKDHRYILYNKYENIYITKENNSWVYSKETTELIPSLIKEAYPYGLHKLLLLFPFSGDTVIFGMYEWQFAGIIAFIFIAICLFYLLRFFTRRLILSYLASYGIQDKKRKLIRNIATPLVLTLLFYFLEKLLPILRIPYSSIYIFFTVIIQLLPILYITVALIRLCDVLRAILMSLALKTESKMDDQLVPIFIKVLKLIVYIGAFIFVLLIFNIDLMPVLAGLSLGGLALALAAQDTLKNVFASVMIFLDKPFQIGDVIISGDISGTIEEVGVRSSLIRTFTNSLQYVPNNMLANAVIDNLGKREFRRFRTMVGVTYDTPTYKIDMFSEGIKKIILSMDCTKKDSFQVYLNEFAASSLNIILNVHFKVSTWDAELEARHHLIKKILELAETIEVSIAFPTQTIHIVNTSDDETAKDSIETEKEEWKNKMDEWLKKNTNNAK